MRASTALAVTFLLVLSSAPLAAASHWTVTDSGIGVPSGVTFEDDAQVMRGGGTAIDGRQNRVSLPGTHMGDGSYFLDARFANLVGTFELDAGRATFETAGRSSILLPGSLHMSVWYGAWLDANTNGAIDDIHDAGCNGSACPADEFTWRGIGSGEPTVGVIGMIVPFAAVAPLHGGGNWANPDRYNLIPIQDHTAKENAEQGWRMGDTASINTVDGGFLTDVQTLVLAGAAPITGQGNIPRDLNDPSALTDVDRYSAIDPDVATLWKLILHSSADDLDPGIIKETQGEVEDEARAQVAEIVTLVNDTAGSPPPLPDTTAVFDAFRDFDRDGTEPMLRPLIPSHAKEPNTVADDYGGRALFGGYGDALGSYNSYPGYEDRSHFYMDNTPIFEACAGVRLDEPVTAGNSVCAASPTRYVKTSGLEPAGAVTQGQRSAGTLLTFTASAFLWRDVNGDASIGYVCDPTGPDFNAERNHCERGAYAYPHAHTFLAEVSGVCASTTLQAGAITLEPFGGPWPNVLVIRDYRAYGSRGVEGVELVSDSAPITLRFADLCASSNTMRTRDALMLTTGASTIGIQVSTTALMPAWLDASTGAVFGPESVTDVDFLVAAL